MLMHEFGPTIDAPELGEKGQVFARHFSYASSIDYLIIFRKAAVEPNQ